MHVGGGRTPQPESGPPRQVSAPAVATLRELREVEGQKSAHCTVGLFVPSTRTVSLCMRVIAVGTVPVSAKVLHLLNTVWLVPALERRRNKELTIDHHTIL